MCGQSDHISQPLPIVLSNYNRSQNGQYMLIAQSNPIRRVQKTRAKTHLDGHKLWTQKSDPSFKIGFVHQEEYFLASRVHQNLARKYCHIRATLCFSYLGLGHQCKLLGPMFKQIFILPLSNTSHFSLTNIITFFFLTQTIGYLILYFFIVCWFTLSSILQPILDYTLLA